MAHKGGAIMVDGEAIGVVGADIEAGEDEVVVEGAEAEFWIIVMDLAKRLRAMQRCESANETASPAPITRHESASKSDTNDDRAVGSDREPGGVRLDEAREHDATAMEKPATVELIRSFGPWDEGRCTLPLAR